jgi:hypothetical protein
MTDQLAAIIDRALGEAPEERGPAYGPVPCCHGHFPHLAPTPAPLGAGVPVPRRDHAPQQGDPKPRGGVSRWAGIPERRIVAKATTEVFGVIRYTLSCGHERRMVKHTRPRVPCLMCPRGSESDE